MTQEFNAQTAETLTTSNKTTAPKQVSNPYGTPEEYSVGCVCCCDTNTAWLVDPSECCEKDFVADEPCKTCGSLTYANPCCFPF